MQAGSLEIELAANVARLRTDMQQATSLVQTGAAAMQRAADAAKASLAGLAAGLSVAAFVGQIKQAVELADQLNKLSQRTGIAVENLSQLQYAAKLSDVSSESLTGAIKKLNVAIAEGLAGDKEKIAQFKALGITTADLGRGTEQVMLRMANAFAGANDGAGKTALAVGLLGKAGDEMIPLLNGGAASILKLKNEADRLGLTISGDFARQAEEFNDNLTRLRTGSQALAIALGGETVKALGDIAQAFTEAKLEADNAHSSLAALFGEGLKTTVQTIAVLFVNTAYVIKQTGVEIGGMAAQLAALARLDFTGFNAISEAIREDAARARAEVDKMSASILGLGKGDSGGAGDFARADRAAGIVKTTLAAPGKASENSEYDSLIKRIKERLELSGQEIAVGRELTDVEKFDAKVTADLALLKKGLTEAQKKQVEQLMAGVRAEEMILLVQRSELELAKQIAAARQAQRNADYEQSAGGIREIEAAQAQSLATVRERIQSLKDEQEALRIAGERNVTLAEAVEMVAVARLREKQAGFFEGSEGWKAIQQEIDKRKELADLLKNSAEIEKFRDLWQSVDRTAQDAFTNIFEGGRDTFKRLTDTLKSTLLSLLYQMTVRPFVLNIVASATGTGGSIAQAATGGTGGGFLGNIGSMFSGGSSLANIAGTSFANITGTGLDGFLATNGAFGTAGGALGAIGTAMPYIAAAVAIASLLAGSFKGETRNGGQYLNGKYLVGPSGGEINGDATRQAIAATQQSINAMLSSLGSSQQLAFLAAGLESSKEGKGFAYAGAQLSGGMVVGQGIDGYGWQNRRGNKTDAQAAADFAEELKQVQLEVIAASDAVGPLADYVRSLGSVSALTGEQLDAAINRINKAMTERQQLEARLFDLTATDLEKLNRQRDAERAAIDETNKALLEQVYAAEDAKKAAEAAAQAQTQLRSDLMDAYDRESSAIKDTMERHQQFAASLRAFIKQLTMGPQALLSPEAQYIANKAEFQRVAGLAASGDETALGQFQSVAEAFLQASQQYYASSGMYFVDLAAVKGATEAAAVHAEATADVQRLQLNAMQAQLSALGLLNATAQQGFAQLLAAYTAQAQGSNSPAAVAAYAAANGIPADRIVNTANGSYIGPMTPQLPALSSSESAALWAPSAASLYSGNSASTMTGEGLAYWQSRIDSGESLSSVQAAFNASVAYVNGSHATGLWSVPFDGYRAELHQGERVLTAAQASSADRTAALIEQLLEVNKRQEAELAALRAQSADGMKRSGSSLERIAESSKASAQTALLLQVKPVPA